MSWYRADDYPKILRIMIDSDCLPQTFREFERKAETGFREMTAKGHVVERVYIDPDEFVAWCAERGVELDTRARQRFCAEFVARKYKNAS
jgi:hypothetical protein